MTGGIEDFYVHTVVVETWLGTGAMGDVYQSPATVQGFMEGKTALVRDSTGQQVVAQSTFYCSVVDGAKFTPDSRITVASPGSLAPSLTLTDSGTLVPSSVGDRIVHVISQNVNDAPGLGLPEHSAIYLK
jgi:hypothetical protein